MADEQFFNPFDASIVHTDDQDWIPSGVGGNRIKILRVSSESGAWSMLIKAPAGQVNPPHTHLGPADFYVLSGGFDYRGGSVRAGDWVYEPAGAVHEATSHPMDTIYLANFHGPVAFHREDGGYARVMDWRAVKALAEAAEKSGR